jgi:hypothetical protein
MQNLSARRPSASLASFHENEKAQIKTAREPIVNSEQLSLPEN